MSPREIQKTTVTNTMISVIKTQVEAFLREQAILAMLMKTRILIMVRFGETT